ncbi:hypothetical protein COLO4_02253 [Corchorus olitorius]|uniref:Uncharacterized protein n=1 Tax=Corchorus olitorius TaxID=93759 RepID=A0A1R3L1E6_9ROSI|nr:hypothetical protein COLO4_02253 [Corchorus olitorius]
MPAEERIKLNAAISLKRPYVLNQRLLECDIGKKCRINHPEAQNRREGAGWSLATSAPRYRQPPAQRRCPSAVHRTTRVPAARRAAQFGQGSAAREARATSAGLRAADRCTRKPPPPVRPAASRARRHRDRDKRASAACRPARATRRPLQTAPRCGPEAAERTRIKRAA